MSNFAQVPIQKSTVRKRKFYKPLCFIVKLWLRTQLSQLQKVYFTSLSFNASYQTSSETNELVTYLKSTLYIRGNLYFILVVHRRMIAWSCLLQSRLYYQQISIAITLKIDHHVFLWDDESPITANNTSNNITTK